MKIMKAIRKKASLVIKKFNFYADYKKFKRLQIKQSRLPLVWQDRHPVLSEKTQNTRFDAHYIYHPAWAAGILAQTRPSLHVDISSSLHFCSIVSAFIKTEFYDYRPVQLNLDNLTCKFADLMDLPFADNSVASLSCMHVIEHIGLGRYGDMLDPDGDLKAMAELQRVLRSDGKLIVVVPVGKPRICFNAHRIYDPVSIPEYFRNLELKEFAVVTDSGQFFRDVLPADYRDQKYACGCFLFHKK